MKTAGSDMEVSPSGGPRAGGPTRPSPEVIMLVASSCETVAARPVALAEAFYQQLFEMAPHTRAMFPPDMSGQMQKMSDTLLLAITVLGGKDTAELEATLRRLGAQHRISYGVEAEHYLYVGHALTRAVREVSGVMWSGSLSSAWIAVYQWVAAHMIEGDAEAAGLLGTAAVEAGAGPQPNQTHHARDARIHGIPAQERPNRARADHSTPGRQSG